jgi:hypothetical protein
VCGRRVFCGRQVYPGKIGVFRIACVCRRSVVPVAIGFGCRVGRRRYLFDSREIVEGDAPCLCQDSPLKRASARSVRPIESRAATILRRLECNLREHSCQPIAHRRQRGPVLIGLAQSGGVLPIAGGVVLSTRMDKLRQSTHAHKVFRRS